jgi:hypothetical protein
LSGVEVRVYNGPKPIKKCSACTSVIKIGDKYWRGLEGTTRACLPCGSRLRAEVAHAAAMKRDEERAAGVADRRRHRDARRAALLGGDILA